MRGDPKDRRTAASRSARRSGNHAADCGDRVAVFPAFCEVRTRRVHLEWRIPTCTCVVAPGHSYYLEERTER